MSCQDDERANGNVLSIPLIIEDKSTNDIIKTSKLYLYITAARDIPSDEPKFVNISITGVYQDGSFHALVTSRSLSSIFRDNIDANQAIDIINRLFPIDESVIEDAEDVEYGNLVVSARLMGSKASYDASTGELLDSQDDPNEGPVVMSIKTDAKIPITIGSITLEAVDLETDPQLKDQSNLFSWLDSILGQNQQAFDEIRRLRERVQVLETENYMIKQSYETNVANNKLVVEDLEQKFYQLLESKKDKIWQLTKDQIPQDRLEGLNEEYVRRESKLNNIKKEEISDTLDTKYLRKRNKPGAAPSLKRRRGPIKKEHDEAVDIGDDSPDAAHPKKEGSHLSSFSFKDEEIVSSVLGNSRSREDSSSEEGTNYEDNDEDNEEEDDNDEDNVDNVDNDEKDQGSEEDGRKDEQLYDQEQKIRDDTSVDQASDSVSVVGDSLGSNAQKSRQKTHEDVETDYSSDDRGNSLDQATKPLGTTATDEVETDYGSSSDDAD